MAGIPIRGAEWPASASRPMGSPIQPSTAHAAECPDALDAIYEGRDPGYTYAREGHPNADALARRIDELENAEGGIVVGSGMAAVGAALLGLLKAGDHVVGGDRLYGRSTRLLVEVLPGLGIAASLADPSDAACVERALRPETRAILVETISNPTLRISDLEGIAALARDRGVLLAVDNTFATPRAHRPLDLGADIVIHSVTKLLAGHSDATLGYMAARDLEIRERLRGFAVTMGLAPSPFDCWLAERGLMTFELRYDRAEANARALADALADMAGVRRVIQPGRADHPDRERAKRLLGARVGNMASFEIEGGRPAANALVRAATNAGIVFAPTLGDVATTLSHPASSSHRGLTPAERDRFGLGEGFFRISSGIEEAGELIAAFERAVAAARLA